MAPVSRGGGASSVGMMVTPFLCPGRTGLAALCMRTGGGKAMWLPGPPGGAHCSILSRPPRLGFPFIAKQHGLGYSTLASGELRESCPQMTRVGVPTDVHTRGLPLPHTDPLMQTAASVMVRPTQEAPCFQTQSRMQAHARSQRALRAHMLSLCVYVCVCFTLSARMLWKPKQKGACECGHHQG